MKRAASADDLRESLRTEGGEIVFTTIEKFRLKDGEVAHEVLSSRSNIIVITDEAHRSQYGFKASTVDVKDSGGEVVGQRVVYGFAKYLRDALPGATYLGFTGTPIEKTDVNTVAVFGNYVDIYDIAQAVEDEKHGVWLRAVVGLKYIIVQQSTKTTTTKPHSKQ